MVDSSTGYTQATATYGVANELLGLTYFGITESRSFNSRLHMTEQSISGLMDLHYNYPTGPIMGRLRPLPTALRAKR